MKTGLWESESEFESEPADLAVGVGEMLPTLVNTGGTGIRKLLTRRIYSRCKRSCFRSRQVQSRVKGHFFSKRADIQYSSYLYKTIMTTLHCIH